MAGGVPPGGLAGIGAQPGGNPVLQLLTGIAQIPAAIQAKHERRQVEEQNRLVLDSQRMQVGQQALAPYMQQALADPRLASDPAHIAKMVDIGKKYNVPVALKDGPNPGQRVLDIEAMQPSRSFRSATMADRLQLAGLDPEERVRLGKTMYTDLDGADPFWTQPAFFSFNKGAQEHLQTEVSQKVDALGKGTVQPGEFMRFVRANYAHMKAMGIDADQYLTDEFKHNTAGAMAAAQINKLEALGVHMSNRDALLVAATDEKAREFDEKNITTRRGQDITKSLGQGKLAIAQQNARTAMGRLQVAQQNANTAVSRLDQGERRLDIAAQQLQINKGRFQESVFKDAFQGLDRDYTQAQNLYAKAIGEYNTTVANGQVPPPQLVDQMTAMKKRVDDLEPKVRAGREMLRSQPAAAHQQATGRATTVVGGADVYSAGQLVPENPDYKFTSATKIGADGATYYEVKPAKGGKARWWKPPQ